MRVQRHRQRRMIGVKVTDDFRALIDRMVATLTLRRKQRHTITDVVIEGLELLAEREKVK